MNINNLPKALPEEEQKILLKKLPDPRAKDALIIGNLRLVLNIAKKYSDKNSLEDIFSIGIIGLIKAIDNFNMDANIKLSTFAHRCITNEILVYFRSERKSVTNCISLYQPLSTDSEELLIEDVCPDYKSVLFFDLYPDKDSFLSILNYLSNVLFEKSYRDFIIFFYMLGENNRKDVGEIFNLSASYTARLFNKLHQEIISLYNDDSFLTKSYTKYFKFFLKDTDLYVGISTMLLKNDYFKFLDCIEKSDNYIFVTFPFEQESFVDIAEMFRNLHESHMMSK